MRQVPKIFNTAGPFQPDIHYNIDPSTRIDQDELDSLIYQRKYFVLHAPRQTGKTSCLLALRDYLNTRGEFYAVYANVEVGQASRNNVEEVNRNVVSVIAREASRVVGTGMPSALRLELEKEEAASNLLGSYLDRLCESLDRPLLLFIDEIDAIGKKRDNQLSTNDEREQTLNQLLTEMDGFEGNNGVIILAATNRPESLDPALTRPGRFDRRVPVELPDLAGREAILRVHAKKIKVAPDVDLAKIARMASGASGAELANIVNEAALRAVRDGRASATQADLEESIEVVIAGYQKKNSILTTREKLIVSYHEIGHALVAAKQTNSAPVQKITIIPRTSGALGYTMQVEDGDHYLMSREEIENKIATFTGGRAAEEVVFHSVTTGASNDIEQATKLARAMITRYGMSDNFDMVALETVTNQYLGGDASLACSAETQAEIDRQVVDLVKNQHAKAVRILQENRPKLDELAKFLYEKETITGEEFMEILNQ